MYDDRVEVDDAIYNGVASIDDRMSTANTLNAAQLGEQQASNRLHRQTNRLLDEANRQREETNRQLEALGLDSRRTLEEIRRVRTSVDKGTDVIRDEGERIERLLGEQSGRLDAIRESVDRQTVNQAYQFFAQWRQTPDGRTYLAWETKVRNAMQIINTRTDRMRRARDRDMETETQRLVAQHAEMRGPRPEQPEHREQPKDPGEFTMRPPGDRPKGGDADQVKPFAKAGLIIGLIIDMIVSWTGTDGQTESFDWGSLISWWIHLFRAIGAMFTNCLIVFTAILIGIIVGAVIVFTSTPEQKAYDKRKKAYDTALQQYRDARKAYENALPDIRRQTTEQQEYEQRMAQWRIDYEQCVKAASLTIPDASCWADTDIHGTVREWRRIIETAMFRPPDVTTLPDIRIPGFADPDALPDNASNMRVELARLIDSEKQ